MFSVQVRRFVVLCGLGIMALCPAASGTAFAMQKEYRIGPAPAWVKRIASAEAPVVPVEQLTQGVYYLLSDIQVRVEPRTKIAYRHLAAKAVNGTGVEEIAHVEISFDPSYQSLTLHSINVRRGARVISKLKASAIRVLQREKALEYRIYDGGKTVNVFLDDIRVGDIVEYAYSLRGANPVFGNRQFGWFDLQWAVPIHRLYGRLLWPAGRKLHLANHNAEVKPKERKLKGYREYEWDTMTPPALIVEDGAPGWYNPYASVQWSEFEDWGSVARWAQPLYRVPGRLGAALQTEVDRIARANADPGERLLAVLRFVQREIRYLGVEIGAGSHAPSPPQVVLERRFGDCKDKALLTVAMLNALGIEARPALVNTALRRGIGDLHPVPAAFNHVIVQARLVGRDFWIDPTRPLQKGDLAHLYQPDYGYALVIDAGSGVLSSMSNSAAAVSRTIHATFDMRAGLDEPVLYTVTSVLEGASADGARNALASENREELQKQYLNFYAKYFSGITVRTPFTMVEEENANRLTLTEQYAIPGFWKRNDAKKRQEARIYAPDLEDYLRLPAQSVRLSPLAIAHPVDLKYTAEVLLPEAWNTKPSRTAVDDGAFSFERVISEKDKTLVLADRFQSRIDHITAGDTARYAANLDRVHDEIGYVLYKNDAAPAAHAGVVAGMPWSVATAAFLFLPLWTWLAVRLYRYDPPFVAPADTGVQGIGGWLILPAIGVVALPLRILVDLGKTMPSFAAESWAVLTTAGSAAYHPMWAPVLLFELGTNLAQFVFSLLLLLVFFKKRRSAPFLYIGVLGASLLLHATDLVLAGTIPAAAAEIGPKDWSDLARFAAALAIWGSYFRVSKRVKATFVNGYDE